MTRLLLATNNRGKMAEIRAILSDLELEILTPADLQLELEVPEVGKTYAENAALKGAAFCRASGLPTLADDSGLEVEALDGAPGLYSNRFAPISNPTDADRRKYLIERLLKHPRPWKARFRCTVALTRPAANGQVRVSYHEGFCYGEIIPEERGEGGFGYDPIFYFPEEGRTMAELGIEKKNRISHRGRAVQAAKPALVEILQGRA